MEEVSKTCLTIKDNEGYHWTSEIYTILELDKTTNINTTKENLLSKYTTKENQQKKSGAEIRRCAVCRCENRGLRRFRSFGIAGFGAVERRMFRICRTAENAAFE